jgi:hypothetical protein
VEKLLLVSPCGVGERPSDEELKEKIKDSGWMFNLVAKVWEMDVSPQGIARGLGPLGKRLLSGYTDRRFGHLEESEKEFFNGYFTSISLQKGSGEVYDFANFQYSVSKLLLPGAWARFPLHHRLPEIGKSIPISFMYGTSGKRLLNE